MGWLVQGDASEHFVATKMEILMRLRHELTFMLIVTFLARPLLFTRMNLQRGAGLRQRPHGSKLQSMVLSWRMCALTCLRKRCLCKGLNVTVGWHFRHSSLLVPFSIMSMLVSKSSIVKHTFPVKCLHLRAWQFNCYRLDKWLNCLVVGVTPHGSAVCMTHVSYTNRASVRGPVGGHQSNWSILLGYPCLVSG